MEEHSDFLEGCPADERQNREKSMGVSRHSCPWLREAPEKEEPR